LPDRTVVFACEPQPIIIEALHRILAESAQFHFAGAAAGLADALEAIRHVRPQVILIDQSYGLKPTSQFLAAVSTISPGSLAVLWVAETDGDDWTRAFQIGARGVLRKTLPVSTLLQCLQAVCAGQWWMGDSTFDHVPTSVSRNAGGRLTPREREVVRCVCRGLRNREIGEVLGITSGTVKVHLMHVFEKTGVKDRFELAAQGYGLLAQTADSV
jgi:DNA-binding NarL/FixJ family response regulator